MALVEEPPPVTRRQSSAMTDSMATGLPAALGDTLDPGARRSARRRFFGAVAARLGSREVSFRAVAARLGSREVSFRAVAARLGSLEVSFGAVAARFGSRAVSFRAVENLKRAATRCGFQKLFDESLDVLTALAQVESFGVLVAIK